MAYTVWHIQCVLHNPSVMSAFGIHVARFSDLNITGGLIEMIIKVNVTVVFPSLCAFAFLGTLFTVVITFRFLKTLGIINIIISVCTNR